MHTLTLVVPDLSRLLAAARSVRLRFVHRMVSRSTALRHDGTGLAAWYCRRYGLVPGPDWPVAALLVAAGGGDSARYWICADPANLAVDRDRLVMMRAPALSESESADLFESMEKHLANDGLQIQRIDRSRWCIGCADTQDLSGTEPSLAVGRDIDTLLLRGNDAAKWLRRGTELQMLLHDHPVNLARASRAEPPVNSLWLWGGGRLPPVPPSATAVCATTPLPKALAQLSGATATVPHEDLPATLATHAAGNVIVAPANAGGDAFCGDVEAEALAWEQAWLAPAWRALTSREFDRLELVGMHDDGMIELSVGRAASWKFWRRRNPALLTAAATQ